MALSKKSVGLLIKNARKIRGEKLGKKYTQESLAKDLDISRSYIGDMEAGRMYPNYSVLSKITQVCELDLNYFSEKEVKNVVMDNLQAIEKNTDDISKKSIASTLIDTLLEQNFFEDPEDISEDTVATILNALRKDIKRTLDNKNKE